MKPICYTFAVFVFLSGIFPAQSTGKKELGSGLAREKFVGAWHLAQMDEQATDGKVTRLTNVKGMLLYTRDGHMSVQLMFPDSESVLSNDYVKNGYEASFGSYEVNEAAHTVTHHVEGSITRGLVGKDLPRLYQFSDGRLIVKSTRPEEHWSATWERY
jgi:hypothetical protein